MILSDIKTKKSDGFTLVELLIVIVIIAILAAITIVAYNGITNRARAAKYASEASQLSQKFEAYNANLGHYPPNSIVGSDAATVTVQTAIATLVGGVMNGTTTPESALPSALGIFALLPVATAPTYTQAMNGINASTSADYYFVSSCNTGGGAKIYYPNPTNSSVVTLTVGTCP